MKKILVVVLIVVATIVALSFVRDIVLKSVISLVVTQVTGAKTEIDRFSLNIIKQAVNIDGFKMYNPKGFSNDLLIDMPKIAVDCNIFALLKGKIHLRKAELNLKELGLEKNKDGKLNVDSLKVVQQQQEAKEFKDAKASPKKKPAKDLAIQIDLLNLQVGRIVSRDHTVGKEPSVQVYDINFKKTYKNIASVQQLMALVIAEPMKQAGIKGAAIYGVAMLAGVAILPVAIVATFAGKDSVQQNFDIPFDRLYEASIEVLKKIGKITKENKAKGLIAANVNGADITVQLKQLAGKTVQMSVSARKYMLPKPETASGVLYQITEKLK